MNSPAFNPEMLIVARDYRGYSQTKAAKMCGISQAKYSKIENGITLPSEQVIDAFDSAFKFPKKFFFKNARAIGAPMSFHEIYRKPKSVNVKSLSQVSADLNIRMFCLSSLLKSVDLEPELTLPEYDADDYNGSGAEIARMVRRTWLIPDGPIRNLTDIVERAGIIVFPCFLPASRVDGVTINTHGLPPIIFLNEGASADRLRFSLAHELGHVIMHRQMSHTMEVEANEFAAELLMPEREMMAEFSNKIDIKELARLKRIRKTSMAALLYRAKTIGKLTNNQSAYLYRQMAPYRAREPESTQFEKETPNTLRSILELFAKNLGYTNDDLADTFGLYTEMIERLFNSSLPMKSKLRLVIS